MWDGVTLQRPPDRGNDATYFEREPAIFKSCFRCSRYFGMDGSAEEQRRGWCDKCDAWMKGEDE